MAQDGNLNIWLMKIANATCLLSSSLVILEQGAMAGDVNKFRRRTVPARVPPRQYGTHI
ncbi:MAG TPA: hypothetical protein VKX41_06185 [Alloacidobacterium sp.]|jgi:hypothetical protein|nr:hypothetical protein [Alloacidobacterium sp.]